MDGLVLDLEVCLKSVEPLRVTFQRTTLEDVDFPRTSRSSEAIPEGQAASAVQAGEWRQCQGGRFVSLEAPGGDGNLSIDWSWGEAYNNLKDIGASEEFSTLPLATIHLNSNSPSIEGRGVNVPGEFALNWVGFPMFRQLPHFGDPALVAYQNPLDPSERLYLFDQEPGQDGVYGAPVLLGWSESKRWMWRLYILGRALEGSQEPGDERPCIEVLGRRHPINRLVEVLEWQATGDPISGGLRELPIRGCIWNFAYNGGLTSSVQHLLNMDFEPSIPLDRSIQDWLSPGPQPWALVSDKRSGENWIEYLGDRIEASEFLSEASIEAARLRRLIGRNDRIEMAPADVSTPLSCGMSALWAFAALLGKAKSLSEVQRALGERGDLPSLSLEDLRQAAIQLGIDAVACKLDFSRIDAMAEPLLVHLSGGRYSEPHFAVAGVGDRGIWVYSPPDPLHLLSASECADELTGYCLATSHVARALGIELEGNPVAPPVSSRETRPPTNGTVQDQANRSWIPRILAGVSGAMFVAAWALLRRQAQRSRQPNIGPFLLLAYLAAGPGCSSEEGGVGGASSSDNGELTVGAGLQSSTLLLTSP